MADGESPEDILTEVRFWSQVIEDSRCIVFVNPDLESRVKSWVDARWMSGIIEVVPSPHVPLDKVFIIDSPALRRFL